MEGENNEEIISYKKIMDDKINQIKLELNLYKNKNQNNIDKYDDFYEKINVFYEKAKKT